MGEENFIVFYAWQSDSPSSVNRNFIEAAAKKALEAIKGIIDRAPRLDKDTKDIPGIPDIANTILNKIRLADVFLADLSYVGNVHESTEPIPNPNVMIELGYALSELGGEKIITVINTHFGSPESLPFDLRNRRWPITYTLSPEAETEVKQEVKKILIKNLSEAINSIAKLPPREKQKSVVHRVSSLEGIVGNLSGFAAQYGNIIDMLDKIHKAQANQTAEPDTQEICGRNRTALLQRIKKGEFENLPPDVSHLVITICPETPLDFPLDIFGHRLSESLTLKLQPLYATSWHHITYGDRLITTSNWQGKPDAATEITINGTVNAAGHEILTLDRSYFQTSIPEDIQLIPSVSFEKSVIEAIGSYGNALRELGVKGTIYVGLGLVNLGKTMLYVGSESEMGARVHAGGDIMPSPVAVPESVDLFNLQPLPVLH